MHRPVADPGLQRFQHHLDGPAAGAGLGDRLHPTVHEADHRSQMQGVSHQPGGAADAAAPPQVIESLEEGEEAHPGSHRLGAFRHRRQIGTGRRRSRRFHRDEALSHGGRTRVDDPDLALVHGPGGRASGLEHRAEPGRHVDGDDAGTLACGLLVEGGELSHGGSGGGGRLVGGPEQGVELVGTEVDPVPVGTALMVQDDRHHADVEPAGQLGRHGRNGVRHHHDSAHPPAFLNPGPGSG